MRQSRPGAQVWTGADTTSHCKVRLHAHMKAWNIHTPELLVWIRFHLKSTLRISGATGRSISNRSSLEQPNLQGKDMPLHECWCSHCRARRAFVGPSVAGIHTVWVARCESEPGPFDQGQWRGFSGTPLRSCMVVCHHVRIRAWPCPSGVMDMQTFRMHLAGPPHSPSWLSFVPYAAPHHAWAIRPR